MRYELKFQICFKSIFLFKLTRFMTFHKYLDKQILNMDESAIYLDVPANYSFAAKGSKRVKASTSGAERVRLSTAFTASASGSKLPIYTIIPRMTPIPEIYDIPQILAKYKKTSIFDSETVVDYLEKVVLLYKNHHNLDRILLVLDRAKVHETTLVRIFHIVKFFLFPEL